MSLSSVCFRTPDGARVRVYAGGILGRTPNADLYLQDPRISEAHALVSLRGNGLQLLELRGMLFLDGKRTSAIELARGQQVLLAGSLLLTVEDIHLPSHALVLYGVRDEPRELSASTYSLVLHRPNDVVLVPGYREGAEGYLWSSADELRIQLRDQPAELVAPERVWTLGESVLRVVAVPTTGFVETLSAAPRDERLRIIARYTSIHFWRTTEVLIMHGRPAMLLSELVRCGGKPVPWEIIAREIWSRQSERHLLRQNWDRTLGRIRDQLRRAEIRENLVQVDRNGNIELVLGPHDEIVDET
ncbi:FHA domain-containing protein [Nannocystis radixulma]|uniref:FHA domain-containing protein n=1 Tax=Nannocystis radixulma TaxID=2995305 RepID=A0ABT5BNM2_9BACT|nr:FHA domain-containing protein [Nannocystis radixulma]MDC0675774.1 FHA domain-containing protein [Nannocystis radixulma]